MVFPSELLAARRATRGKPRHLSSRYYRHSQHQSSHKYTGKQQSYKSIFKRGTMARRAKIIIQRGKCFFFAQEGVCFNRGCKIRRSAIAPANAAKSSTRERSVLRCNTYEKYETTNLYS